MGYSAQGTKVFALVPTLADPSVMEVLPIDCINSIDLGSNTASNLEDTCLEDDDRSYIKGLRTPGQATVSMNTDPRNASHVRLAQLFEADDNQVIKWAVGWPDGRDVVPTMIVDSNGEADFELPDTRTWALFSGYISDFPFSHQVDTPIQTQMTIQRSGKLTWMPKA